VLAPLAASAASADAGCLGRHSENQGSGTPDMAHCIACRGNSQRSTVRSSEKIKSPPQSSGDRLEAILERAKLTDVAVGHCRQACGQIHAQGVDLGWTLENGELASCGE
jgi:hypothetical protein